VITMKLLENKPYIRVKLLRNGEVVVEAFQNVELNNKRYNIKTIVRSRVEVAPSIKSLIDSAITLLNKKINFIREAEENHINLVIE